MVVDGGHNISSSYVIANWIKNQNQKVNLVVAMMKDKEHQKFMKSFEGLVNSVTLIDIPNQDGGISKNEFKEKIGNLNFNLKISDSIDSEPNTPTKYGIRGIPTMLLFSGGELKATKVGATTKSNIVSWIKENT